MNIFKLSSKKNYFLLAFVFAFLSGMGQKNTDSFYFCNLSNLTDDISYVPFKTTGLNISNRNTFEIICKDTNIKVLYIDVSKFWFKKNYCLPKSVECLYIPVCSSKICDTDTSKIKLSNLRYLSMNSGYCKKIPPFIMTSQALKGITLNLNNELGLTELLNKFTFKYIHLDFKDIISDSLPNLIYSQKELVSLELDLDWRNKKNIKLSTSIENLVNLEKLSLPIILDENTLNTLSKLKLTFLRVYNIDINEISMISKFLPYLKTLSVKKPMTKEDGIKLRESLPNIKVNVKLR